MFFARGQWQRNMDQAQNFDSLAEAIQVALKYHLAGSEVILQIDDSPNPSLDVRLDLLGDGLPPKMPPGDEAGLSI